MLGGQDVPLRMRHQAKHPPGGIANSGDVPDGSVRIPWIGGPCAVLVHVSKDHLAVALQLRQHVLVRGDKLSLRMRHGKIQRFLDAFHEHTPCVFLFFEINPPVLEFPRVVERQGAALFGCVFVPSGQNARLDQYLKAVADPDDQFSLLHKPGDVLREFVLQLIGQNFSGAHVVPVRKSSGDRQNLKLRERLLFPHQLVDVNPRNLGSRRFERIHGLRVAVRSRRP